MLKIGFASILFFFTYKSYSQQQGYLILIDAENSRPFHARIGDKVFPSSDAGHLIIPNLKDSTYILSIGFPGNQYPEQQFAVRTDKKDQGFQLRNRQEEWVLYNWQTSESQKPLKKDGVGIFVAKGVKKDDPFSRLMAAVVNDTAVLYNTYIEEKPDEDTLRAVSRTAVENGNRPDSARKEQEARVAMDIDSAIAAAEKSGKTNVRITRSSEKTDTVTRTDTLQAAAIAVKADTLQALAPDAAGQKAAKNKIPSGRPVIRKLSERPLKFSLKLVYLDGSKPGPVDTIAIYVPYDKPVSADSAKEKTQIKESGKLPAQQALPAIDSTKAKTGDKQKQLSKRASADSAKAAKLAAGKKKKTTAVSDCQNLATDYDLALLRVDILTANSIDDKIKAAGVSFKTKCFSIGQIKTLGELFASDESRYRFYNAAYPYISDRDNFSQLLSQLSDEKYIKRFREIGK